MQRTIQRRPWLLCVGNEKSDLASQSALFASAGYSVDLAHSELEAYDAISRGAFDIAVIDYTFSAAVRTRLAQGIRRRAPEKLVLILHASGGRRNPYADAAIDSRKGGDAILDVLQRLQAVDAIRGHRHPALQHEYVVATTTNGRYAFASDAACGLLGYTRAEFMDAAAGGAAPDRPNEVSALLLEIMSQHCLGGDFLLQHRDGSPVPVAYRSTIESDGCVIVWWELAGHARASSAPTKLPETSENPSPGPPPFFAKTEPR